MDSLQFAINMELEGEKYYAKQAQNNSLKPVFLMLAKEEANHAKILQHKQSNLPYELNDSDILLQANSIFSSTADFKSTQNQLDVYRFALEKEEQSIELYKKMLSENEGNEIFEYLIKQEQNHYEILNNLIIFVSRPDNWAESAEFGIREEY